jgi:uncharacterized membrane protein (DUF106 family)
MLVMLMLMVVLILLMMMIHVTQRSYQCHSNKHRNLSKCNSLHRSLCHHSSMTTLLLLLLLLLWWFFWWLLCLYFGGSVCSLTERLDAVSM